MSPHKRAYRHQLSESSANFPYGFMEVLPVNGHDLPGDYPFTVYKMIAVRMAQQAQEDSYRNIFVKCCISCIFH